mmetsp:Transcript_126477/g.316187  ORF Transcript_126477/g.316187 Transcript_126477/m.316187 type:complete len:177 (+) Transcript_126477:63-593(+)
MDATRQQDHGQQGQRAKRARLALAGLFVAPAVALLSSLWASNPGETSADLGRVMADTAEAAFQAVWPTQINEKQPHLIGFYAEQSIESKRMKYLGELLEEELPGTRIVWLEAWENPLNERLRATIDMRNQCGGVPYLFNRKTGKVLCGIQAYDKLRAWAQGLGGDARIYRDIGGGN